MAQLQPLQPEIDAVTTFLEGSVDANIPIRAISAFIWQSGVQGTLPQQKPGDPEKGREAFETRGCMACHSMGEGGQKQGGTFAANLSREGEKANYDYLVRWVHTPASAPRPIARSRRRSSPKKTTKNTTCCTSSTSIIPSARTMATSSRCSR